MSIHVLVIASHTTLYEALILAIESEPSLDILQASVFPLEIAAFTSEYQPDICVIALERDDANGLQTIAALHQKIPHCPIVAITPPDTPQQTEAALACGARGVIAQPFSRIQLIQQLLILASPHPLPPETRHETQTTPFYHLGQ